MPLQSISPPTRRPSREERVFTDADGRTWSAAYAIGPGDPAIVFTCVTDSRQPVRAIAADPATPLAEAADLTLQEWLRDAPRIGMLS